MPLCASIFEEYIFHVVPLFKLYIVWYSSLVPSSTSTYPSSFQLNVLDIVLPTGIPFVSAVTTFEVSFPATSSLDIFIKYVVFGVNSSKVYVPELFVAISVVNSFSSVAI